MKVHLKLIVCLLTLFLGNLSYSQSKLISPPDKGIESNYFFYSPEGRASFAISSTKIAIKFDQTINRESLAKFKAKYPALKNLEYETLHKYGGYTLVPIEVKISKQEDIDKINNSLNKESGVQLAQPLLIYDDGVSQIAGDEIFIKLNNNSDVKYLDADAAKFGFTILKQYEYDAKTYLLKVYGNKTSLEVANAMFETKHYAAVEPNFTKLLQRFNTNDPNLAAQWSLNNTGSSQQYNGIAGADMDVFNAWSINAGGSSSIRVAVVDEGVDLNHPDLIQNLVPGFDATGQGSGGGPQGNDAHGTACAGIIAATANNNIGLAGVAYNVKIVPVRIAYGQGNSWVTSDAWLSAGIDWAWNQGQADVLSNSWGGGSPSTLINDAIGRAITQGRGNKGSAVLFAAANSNTPVASFPASNNNTIAVIAMSMCDQRKSPTSCDGETFWGSNYGTHCDVAAPGVKIFATDISGAAGYTTGDYIATFNGTSSACPNTAGVMALIYSVNPNLTYAQARTILETTCEKVGGYGYSDNINGQPNGAWSQDLGYGRVNAYYALQLASNAVCNNAPSPANTICSNNNFCYPQNITLALNNTYPLSGTTYQWQQSNDGNAYTNISGATAKTYTTFMNFSKYYRCIITCGSNSTTSTAKLVTYLDNTIINFPHTEIFPGSALPCGWSVQNVNNDTKTWLPIQSTYRSPTYCMYYAKSTTLPADDWLFSAPIAMTAGQSYGVRFFYRSATNTQPEKMEVKWGASPNAASMTSSAIFSNANITNVLYTGANTAVITPTTTGVYYVGFRVFSNANMGSMFLEDVTFDIVAPCNTPLQAGTISGPSTIEAGNSSLSTWTVTGSTGTDLTWQRSSDGGATWVNLPALVTPSITTFIATPGNYLWRTEVTSYNCPPAYSPTFEVTVTPRQGDFFSNPIVGSKYFVHEFNNSAQSGFGSDYTGPNAQPSNDLFFRYTTSNCVDSLFLSTCSSGFDTYVHVLDANGAHIFSIDDGTLCGQTPVFKIPVSPNTVYHMVVEGWNTSNGSGIFGAYEIVNGTANTTITSSNGTNIICQGQPVTLTASPGSSYAWITGETTQSIIVTDPYPYSVTVYDGNNCGSSAEFTMVSGSAITWYQDSDGDGFGNINVSLSACLQPNGYVTNNTDCNDNNSAVHVPITYYVDSDGDGFGSNSTTSLCESTPPNGYSVNNTDCDDNNAAVHVSITYYVDTDGDGYGSTTTALLCASTAPSGYSINNTDCDDNNSAVHIPVTYYVDTDGDGFGSNTTASLCASTAPSGYSINNTDCDDNNAAIHFPITYYIDADGDGFGSNTTASLCASTAPSGYSLDNTDCDDNNAAIHTPNTYYIDADGDGFGSNTTTSLCASTAPSGYSINNADCDDNNAGVNIPQLFYVDADGDGAGSTTSALLCAGSPPPGYSANNVDCDDNNPAAYFQQLFYVDADGDGFGSTSIAILCAGPPPPGYSNNNTDCDDNNAAVNTPQLFYVDADGDGYGSTTSVMLCAALPPSGYSANNTDCNDNNPNVNLPLTWYQDVDGDGYGQIELTLIACTQPTGYVADFTDCNDNDALIHEQNIFYGDTDQDGYGGNVQGAFCLLSPPEFWSVNDDDCNDNNVAINPNALEICGNNVDDNCNTLIDETCCNISISAIITNAMCSNVSNGNINVTVTNGVAPFIYTWSNGASTEDIINLAIGTYSITVTDNTGCSVNASYVVNHNNQAPAAASAIAGPSGACRNQTNVVFSVAAIPGATSYVWTLPNGASGSSSTNVISLNFSNNYNTGNICVRAVNACGQSAQYCRQIIRYTQAPATPGTISGLSRGVCPNTTYSYSITAVNNATSYIWTAPANASIVSGQGTTNVTVSFGPNFGTSGVLSVKSSNCIGNSNNRNVTIQRTPPQPSTITGPSSVCKNQQGVVFSVVNEPDYTYNWVVPGGCTIVSGQGTSSVVVNWGQNSGTIAVQAVVSCSVSPFRSKSVSAVNCSNAPEEIEIVQASLFTIYPNPNNGNTKIYLYSEREANHNIFVYNVQGQIVKQLNGLTQKGENYFDLDISAFINGIYFIRYTNTDGLLHTRTMVKE